MNQLFTKAILMATDKKITETGEARFTMLQRLITCLLILIAAQAFGQVQTFTANGTYTVPAGVYTLEVECWGGGGAGGGATGNPAAGGGGAGGAYVKSRLYVTPGNTFTVTVGVARTATTTSTAATNKGNPSWFGAVSTVFADGGAGGTPATANSTNGAAGAGTTTGSIGNLAVYAGGSGGIGVFTSNVSGGAGGGGAGSTGAGNSVSTLSLGIGGAATSLNGGAGANGVANSTAGAAGNNYGAGGSGGKANNTTDRSGGTGAQGLVIVTPVSPANDDCFYATGLTLNGSAITGNIANAASSLAACSGAEAYDVWYKFTPTCSGSHTITVDPSNSFDAVVQLYSSCGGTAVLTPISGGSCVNAGGDNVNETPAYNLTSGITYYVRVYDYNLTATGYPATTAFTIAVSAPPLPTTANAGPDQTGSATCGATALTLGANNPTSGTGSWSIVSGTGGSFVNASSFNSTFNGTLGSTYTLRWTISTSGCTPSTDDVVVAFNLNPTANAGPDQTSSATCGLTTVTLAGSMNAGTGVWTVISGTGGSFSNASSPTSNFTGTAGSTYNLRWTVTNPPCTQTATDDVVITFNTNPVLTITNPAAVCSNSAGANLTAAAITAGSTGSGTLSYWTNSLGTISLSNPSAVTTAGIYYIRSTTAAGCVDIEPVTVTVTPLPVATFSYTGSPYCSNAANPLPTFSGGGVAGTFSSTAGLAFVSATTGQINLSASTAGTYTVTNTIAAAGGCPVVTATSSVTETNAPSATISYAGSPYCRTTASGAITRTGTAGGTYSASPAGLTINASTGAITPTTSTPGVYTVTYTVAASGGCAAFTTTASVTITALPVATFSYTGTPYCSNAANPLPTFSGGGVAGTFSSTAGLAFVSATTGQINLSASTAGTYTVTNTIAAAGGCSAVTATSPITITTPASATISYSGTLCKSLTSALATFTGTTGGTYSAPAGLSINASTGEINPAASTAGTYTVTYTIAATGGCPVYTTTTSVTIVNLPTPTIATNYCTPGGGLVRLTCSSATTYSWNTGEITQTIDVDIAGTYTVSVTNSSGCVGTTFVNVATELVTNGNFSSGNTSFTSLYTNQQSFYNGTAGSGLIPEGLYAVNTNANSYHPNFFGTDHTTGTGNFMIINGSGAPISPVVWQQTVAVQPNTTYYFSAWAMSVNNVSPYAKLRFAVDDVQAGTIAILNAGPTSNAGPFNWVRFFGTWTSGPSATTAEISILNIETALGGNDFGLDDISFSTLSPGNYAAAPGAGVGGNTVCAASALTVYANRDGGASPFTYAWTGPNGFTSTQENPLVSSSATAAMAGTYNLTITDGNGCATTGSFNLTVNALPTNLTVTASPASVCASTSSNIQLAASQTGVSYQLRNNADNSLVGAAVNGTGGTINLPTGLISATTTYNILALNTTTGCERQMTTTPTVTLLATPVLVITNQARCTGTVNLTAAGVTAGSTGGGTLTYWTNAACTTAVANPTAVGSGTYFIRSAVGSCTDVEAVVVTISTTPVATFNYTGSPFCSSASDPSPTYSGGGVAGVFSSPTGAVFVSTATGQIDLSLTPAGTHTIINTVTPTGGSCTPVSVSRTIVVTASPNAEFSYGSTVLCQNANASDPLPIYVSGASAGTFTSSFGLTFISGSTGQIDLSACTPGNYAVTNTIAAAGGCAATSYTAYILINPYTFSGGVAAAVSASPICSGQTINLASEAPIYLSAILREDFNSNNNNWTTTNSSTGGTPTNAAFTLTSSFSLYDGLFFISNDFTQYYITRSIAQGGGTTATTLRSPAFSTVGYTSLAVDFFQYFRGMSSGDVAKVQVSVDGFNWIDVATYTTTQGSSIGFTNSVVDLIDYINLPELYIRFKYDATNDKYWAIDNVSVTGYSSNYAYSWASLPAGFISGSQNPTGVAPTVTSAYTSTAINTYGCSAASSPASVTVNPSASLSSTLTPPAICSNTAFAYTPTSATSGATFSWTRAAVAGVSNAAVTSAQSSNPNETLLNTTTSPINVVYAYTTTRNGCTTNQNVTVKVNPSNIWNGGTTNWFAGNNWCVNGNGIPTTTTNVTIPSITITGQNPIIDNTNGTGAVARTLVINSGGGLTINGTAGLGIFGSWNNSGTFTPNSSTVTFNSATNDSIVGTSTQPFFNVVLNKGNDTTSVLQVKSATTIANILTVSKGLLSITNNTLGVTGGSTIAANGGIRVAGGTLNTTAGVNNSGLFSVTSGSATVGTATTVNLDNANASRLRINGGTLNVGGNLTATNAKLDFNGGSIDIGGLLTLTGTSALTQTAGSITVNRAGVSSNANSSINIAGASSFNAQGGIIILQNANPGNGGDFKSIPGTGDKTINTVHTLQIGNPSTLASSIFRLNTGATELGRLWVFNANGLVARLLDNAKANTLQLDGVLDLNNNTFIIANAATNAITGSGYVLSETTNALSKLQWNVGNSTGSYVFPFGNALGTAIPFTFNITTQGVQSTSGNITVTTYPTTDNNIPLVSGVTNMTMENGGNGALSTLDRWWVIDANNYTVKPISNMTFRYADIDLNGNPFLAENGLKAQRWDASLNNGLGGWNPPDFFGANTVNTTTNTVSINDVTNYSPWVLHDDLSPGNSPLPIELLSFAGYCDAGSVRLEWKTATEINNDYFTIQRSADMVTFTDIAIVAGAGNSNTILSYSSYDNNPPLGKTTYYRLIQTDFNGEFEVFSPVIVTCANDLDDFIALYPNPANTVLNINVNINSDSRGNIYIYNEVGQTVKTLTIEPQKGLNSYLINVDDLAYGQYYVTFDMNNKRYPVQKLIIIR